MIDWLVIISVENFVIFILILILCNFLKGRKLKLTKTFSKSSHYNKNILEINVY